MLLALAGHRAADLRAAVCRQTSDGAWQHAPSTLARSTRARFPRCSPAGGRPVRASTPLAHSRPIAPDHPISQSSPRRGKCRPRTTPWRCALAQMREQTEREREYMLTFNFFLRLTPFMPNWSASPAARVSPRDASCEMHAAIRARHTRAATRAPPHTTRSSARGRAQWMEANATVLLRASAPRLRTAPRARAQVHQRRMPARRRAAGALLCGFALRDSAVFAVPSHQWRHSQSRR